MGWRRRARRSRRRARRVTRRARRTARRTTRRARRTARRTTRRARRTARRATVRRVARVAARAGGARRVTPTRRVAGRAAERIRAKIAARPGALPKAVPVSAAEARKIKAREAVAAKKKMVGVTAIEKERALEILKKRGYEQSIVGLREKVKKAKPYLEKKVVRYEKINGKRVPITQTYYVSPATGIRRVATKEEREYFEKQPHVLGEESLEKRKIFREFRKEKIPTFIKEKLGIRPKFEERVISKKWEKAIEKGVTTGLYVGTTPLIKARPELKIEKEIRKGKAEFIAGAVTGVLPMTKGEMLKTTAAIGTGTAIGAGLRLTEAGVGTFASRIGPKVSTASRAFIKGTTAVAGTGLAGVYAVGKGREIIAAPTSLEAGKITGKVAREITAFGLGAVAGQRVATRGIQRIRTIGMKEITPPVREAVLLGKEPFPIAGRGAPRDIARLHKQIFEKGRYAEFFKEPSKPAPGFHMAPEKLMGPKVKRPLHIAPEASVHFLKVAGERARVFPKLKQLFEPSPYPTGYAITPKKYKIVIGKEVRRRGYVWEKPVKPGIAYIPGTKTEIQAVFEKETLLAPRPKKAYFMYKGYRVPIKAYEAVGEGIVGKPTKGKITSLKEIQSYTGMPTYYAAGPEAIAYGLRPSYKPAKPSYKPSKPSKPFYKPLPIPSYLATAPSYRPYVSKGYKKGISSKGYYKAISRYSPVPKSYYVSGISPMPKIFYEPKGFKMPRIKPTRPKKKKPTKAELREPVVVTPGYTARVLGITVPEKELKALAKAPSRALGIRAVPIKRKRKK